MYTLTAENARGLLLELTPSPKYNVVGVAGLTPPIATINHSAMGINDGTVYNSSRIEVRNIVLSVMPNFPVEENRIAIYSFFRPKEWVKLHYTNGSRDVVIEGRTESVEGDLFQQGQTLTISVVCFQPYFKSAAEFVNDLAQLFDLFEFPFESNSVGNVFSELMQVDQIVLKNNGEINTGLIIELEATGDVINPIIYNYDTGESIGINFAMKQGDKITINTNASQKSIVLLRNGAKTNVINHLKPSPVWLQLAPGETVFAYAVDSGASYLKIKFSHHDLFAGV